MKFVVTPDEARNAASILATRYKKQKMTVKTESPAWPDAPYRTTLVAEKGGRKILVEAQGSLSYSRSLKDLASWLAANRHYAELNIAVGEEATINVGALREMNTDGVGLLIVHDDGSVHEHQRARNPALVVTPDPTFSLGPSKREIMAAVAKFNDLGRKDGLRDMMEIVERLTEEVGVRAARKGRFKIPEEQFEAKDWSSQINELARRENWFTPHSPIGSGLKDDLQSFRGARNLVDHKARSAAADKARQRQFAERMMQGPRLAVELIKLKRKIR
jgi:hypothetical protein